MATPDTYLAQGSQYVKEIYAPRVVRIYPEANFLVKNIAFNQATRVGKQYVVPIELAPEQGVTYAGPSAGAFSLVGAIALSTQDAIISPSQIVVQRALDYESIQRTVGSKAAFVSMVDATLRSVVALATKRLELSILYGQYSNGIGVVNTATGSGTGAGATRVLNIVPAEWSGGLWGGLENALVDVWATGFTAQRNTVANNLKVQALDLVNQNVTVQNIASDAGLGNIVATDVIVFAGTVSSGPSYNEMAGLFSIASNTGTLFNINAVTYGLWKGNSITSWGAPSLGKILDGVSKLIERGLDEDVVFLCSPKHFSRLNSDQTALRLYDSSYKQEAANGFQQIRFGSENGSIIVRSHRFVKDGYALIFPLSKLMRIGSTELTFTNMGVDGDIFIQTPNTASVELRGYLGQALLCLAPSRTALVSGITYP